MNPVVLGAGKPLSAPGEERLHLELTNTRAFGSGVVVLSCAPAAQHHQSENETADV